MLAGRSRFTLDVGIAHRCARDERLQDERLEDERLEDERLEDEASHLDNDELRCFGGYLWRKPSSPAAA